MWHNGCCQTMAMDLITVLETAELELNVAVNSFSEAGSLLDRQVAAFPTLSSQGFSTEHA